MEQSAGTASQVAMMGQAPAMLPRLPREVRVSLVVVLYVALTALLTAPWTLLLLHACHNAVIQWLFDLMTVETGKAAWFAGEFGVAFAVISILVVIPIWRDGSRALAATQASYRRIE